MAQRILGLDIGSHSVKAVILEAALRRFEVRRFERVPFPPPPPAPAPDEEDTAPTVVDPDESWFSRLAEALGTLQERLGDDHHEVCVTTVPGERVTVRPLDLPFVRAREIEMVLGQEMEEHLPIRDMDEVVFDHQLLSTEGGTGHLLVAACGRSFLTRFLAVLAEHGFDPRSVGAGPLSMAALVREVLPDQPRPVAVLDLGWESSKVCVVEKGRPVMARSLQRGGRLLVRRLAEVYRVDAERAEEALRGDLEILPAQSPVAHHPERQRASAILREALAPIVRGVRQALLAFGGLGDTDVAEIYLCGGLSLLPGLELHLSSSLGLPVRRFDIEGRDWMKVSGGRETEALCAGALSLALSQLPQSREASIDFRQGSFAFQGGYHFVRGKVISLAVLACMVLLSFGFYTWSLARDLAAQEQAAVADLKARTQALLGEAISDPETAIARLRRGAGGPKAGGKFDDIPSRSAYDLFFDISTRLPVSLQVDLESVNIDLDRHRVELRGKTTSATAVEEIVEALDAIPCFKGGIEKEKNEKVGAEGQQLFVLSIKTSC